MLLDFVQCCCAQDTVWSSDSCAGCGVCMALDAEWNCEAWVRCGPCMAVGCCLKLCCVGVLWCLHGSWMVVELLYIGMLWCLHVCWLLCGVVMHDRAVVPVWL